MILALSCQRLQGAAPRDSDEQSISLATQGCSPCSKCYVEAHWSTKENSQNFDNFVFDFSGLWKKWPQMAPNRAGRIFVPTNPDLADILGRTDLKFENFYFFYFWDPKFPDAAAGRTLRSQPDPSPKRTQGSNTSQGPLLRSYGPISDFSVPGRAKIFRARPCHKSPGPPVHAV